jgi:hypothetical protein
MVEMLEIKGWGAKKLVEAKRMRINRSYCAFTIPLNAAKLLTILFDSIYFLVWFFQNINRPWV